MNKEKSEAFYKIIKSLNYPNIDKFQQRSFEYLFDIPETKQFFEWFINNVSSESYISKDDLRKFEDKINKCQVIWNIDRLKSIVFNNHNKINNNDQNYDLESKYSREDLIKASNEKENEIAIFEQQIKLREQHKQALIDRLNRVKGNIKANDLIEHKSHKRNQNLDHKIKCLSNQFNKTIKQLQSKINDEKNEQTCISDSIHQNLTVYLNNEQLYLNKIKEFIKMQLLFSDNYQDDLDTNSLFLSKYLKEENKNNLLIMGYNSNEKDFIENYVNLIHKYYPKLMLKWFQTKVNLEDSKLQVNELNNLVTNLENESKNPRSKQMLDQELKLLETKNNHLVTHCSKIGNQIASELNKLCHLKTKSLIDYDIFLKEIRLNYYIGKQERLLAQLIQQKSRMDLINVLQLLKLNNIESIQHIFDCVKINQHSTIFNQSITATSVSLFSNNYSAYPLSANSTAISLNIKSTQIKPKFSFTQTVEELFVRTMNQLMIKYFLVNSINNSNSQLITIKFSDNLKYLNDIYKQSLYSSNDQSSLTKSNFRQMFQAILNAIQYLYNRDDLSKIRLTTSQLDDLVSQLSTKNKACEDLFVINIFKPYKAKKSAIESNILLKLKRQLFVDFYLRPNEIDYILKYLNETY